MGLKRVQFAFIAAFSIGLSFIQVQAGDCERNATMKLVEDWRVELGLVLFASSLVGWKWPEGKNMKV